MAGCSFFAGYHLSHVHLYQPVFIKNQKFLTLTGGFCHGLLALGEGNQWSRKGGGGGPQFPGNQQKIHFALGSSNKHQIVLSHSKVQDLADIFVLLKFIEGLGRRTLLRLFKVVGIWDN